MTPVNVTLDLFLDGSYSVTGVYLDMKGLPVKVGTLEYVVANETSFTLGGLTISPPTYYSQLKQGFVSRGPLQVTVKQATKKTPVGEAIYDFINQVVIKISKDLIGLGLEEETLSFEEALELSRQLRENIARVNQE